MNKTAPNIVKFAADNRLKVTLDECGDQIIQGKRAHLYFDGAALCLMATDARVAGMGTEVLAALGADETWIGTLYRDAKQNGYRDLKLTGIPKAKWGAAIKVAGCRLKKKLSEEAKAALALRLNVARTYRGKAVQPRHCAEMKVVATLPVPTKRIRK